MRPAAVRPPERRGRPHLPPATYDATGPVVYLSQDSALFTQNSHVHTQLGVRFHAMTIQREQAEHAHNAHLPSLTCLDDEVHDAHPWSSLTHRWTCPGRTERLDRAALNGRHAAAKASATPLTDRMLRLAAGHTDTDDPMPAGLPARVLEAVRSRENLGDVRAHKCSVDGCDRDAVVVPPPACAEHGGLDGRVAL